MNGDLLNKILVSFNRLLYLYRHLNKITSENTIISVQQNLDTLNKSNITGFYSGLSLKTIDYLNFGNNLLSDYETIIRRIADECVKINDQICNSNDIPNKLEIGFDVHDLLNRKYFRSVFVLLFENLKYLVEQLEQKDDFFEKEFDNFEDIVNELTNKE